VSRKLARRVLTAHLSKARALYIVCDPASNRHNAVMSWITLSDAQLAFGDRPLLDGAELSVRSGERVGLIGRNGTGKSTLLQVIAGLIQLDDGQLQRRDGLSIALVEQEPLLPEAPTLRDSLLARANRSARWVSAYADERERWVLEARLAEYLQRFELDAARSPATCSGGERKRAALALAFTLQPELLLLDEPTNHLDISGIARLETLVPRVPASIVITHDRAFLDQITTRIVELDRGVLRSYPGNFAAYEMRKQDELAAEDVARRRFDKFWAQEEVWIRQGVEARRTRNEGRVRRLEQLRVERNERRERLGSVRLSLDAGERSGRLVAELEDVSKSFGERAIIRHLSLRIMRGDRIGLIGANGAGKTTLIGVLLGTLAPDSGRVRLGTQLQTAYFDQLRAQLDPDATVGETISPGSDWVETGGTRKHIASYLDDFLFAPQRARSPVRMLSGGERNRLLLARLFARPANLVVLDEPTNDLDIDSLELLEQKLQEYPGTLLLVSHDRRFLDNVVTQTIVAQGDGTWREYVGGYTDWLRQSGAGAEAAIATAGEPMPAPGRQSSPSVAARERTRLSYNERRELARLPDEIEALESEQQQLLQLMSSAGYHQRGAEQIRADHRRAGELQELVAARLARWEALEAANAP
jgi:ABC transport system ATP-binding/permease protein